MHVGLPPPSVGRLMGEAGVEIRVGEVCIPEIPEPGDRL